MPTGTATTTDEIGDGIRSLIDRVVDAKLTQEMALRGQGVAAVVGDRVSEAWRESRPMRNETATRLGRATEDAAKWGDQTWRKALRPALRDLWKRRTLAIGAAGAAVPAGRELVETASERLAGKRREERHWGSFFLGLLLGAAAGAIVAMLTTPKRGSEMRRELAERADDVRQEVSTRAKDADWVPLFERENGHAPDAGDLAADASGTLQEGAAETGAATGEAADVAAADTAEAINESYEGVDRESPA